MFWTTFCVIWSQKASGHPAQNSFHLTDSGGDNKWQKMAENVSPQSLQNSLNLSAS
jgi:hypothetical protein